MSRRLRKLGRTAADRARAKAAAPQAGPAPVPVDVGQVIARWTAPRTSRRAVVFQLEVIGPLVCASTPEELAAAYSRVRECGKPEGIN